MLVFVQSIERAKELFHELIYDGLNVDVIHSERTQAQRDNVVKCFRTGKVLPCSKAIPTSSFGLFLRTTVFCVLVTSFYRSVSQPNPNYSILVADWLTLLTLCSTDVVRSLITAVM